MYELIHNKRYVNFDIFPHIARLGSFVSFSTVPNTSSLLNQPKCGLYTTALTSFPLGLPPSLLPWPLPWPAGWLTPFKRFYCLTLTITWFHSSEPSHCHLHYIDHHSKILIRVFGNAIFTLQTPINNKIC